MLTYLKFQLQGCYHVHKKHFMFIFAYICLISHEKYLKTLYSSSLLYTKACENLIKMRLCLKAL